MYLPSPEEQKRQMRREYLKMGLVLVGVAAMVWLYFAPDLYGWFR